MDICRPKSGDPPPWKWHIHWEFLDFKSGFGFTTKIYPRLIFIFKWMPSNNSDTNLFLIFEAISTMDASFFSKPFSQLGCRDNKKSCHLLEKKGTYPMRMHDNNTTCNRSNQNAGFLDTTNTTCNRSNQNARLLDIHSRSTNQHPAAPGTQQKPHVTEVRHNAEKLIVRKWRYLYILEFYKKFV